MNAIAWIRPAPEEMLPGGPVADPGPDIRGGVIIAALFFVLFLGWAAFARLDAAAYAPGTLVVSGQRQSVQHRDGGVVGEIFVKEGQRVTRGQLLLRLAAAEVRAQERALSSRAISLLAQRHRLRAEALNIRTIVAPPEFATLAPEDRDEAAMAMRLQQTELAARYDVLGAQRGALGERAQQSGAQGRGYGDQAVSASEQLRLIEQEIDALRPVAEQGFVSVTRMRQLERASAALKGQRGQYRASVAQTAGAARESRLQMLEADRSFRERTASDMRTVENSLGEVMPKLAAARDQLARVEIRAPATGAVVGLSVFTPGGVIAAGQKLMDIVPESTPLIVQAQISPDDADDLRVGQKAMVRFASLHERALPNLEGSLTRLSADSFFDEKSGQSYFTAEFVVPRDQLAMIGELGSRKIELRPGMPVEILIPLRKRSTLDYLLEPLVGTFWSSFREH